MADNTKNYIEVNGKKYDAITGKPVGLSSSHMSPRGQVLDGFVKKKTTTHKQHIPENVSHHKVQKSKTLMRKAVPKPHIQSVSSVSDEVNSINSHGGKTQDELVSRLDPDRLKRAESTNKSSFISRFGFGKKNSEISQSKVHHTTHTTAKTNTKPPMKPPTIATPNAKLNLEKESILNNAIASSNHHQKAHPKHRAKANHRIARKMKISPRTLNITASVLSVLILVGFIAYQNIPNINMRYAATKAGFNANLPGYKPSGFSMNSKVEAFPGQVVISFKSNSDNRNFKIIQSASDWNDQTLLEKYVAMDDKLYQTYQDNGKTIYIYNGSNATWVESGVWYRIEGQSSLTNDQLLRLAASM